MTEEFKKWFKSRPEFIKAQVRKYPPGEYIIKDDAPYAISCPGTKVTIYAYSETGTVKVIVFAKDKLPEAIQHEKELCKEHNQNPDAVHQQNVLVDIEPIYLEPLNIKESIHLK